MLLLLYADFELVEFPLAFLTMLNFLLLYVSKPFRMIRSYFFAAVLEISAKEHLVCISPHFRCFWAISPTFQSASNFEQRCSKSADL